VRRRLLELGKHRALVTKHITRQIANLLLSIQGKHSSRCFARKKTLALTLTWLARRRLLISSTCVKRLCIRLNSHTNLRMLRNRAFSTGLRCSCDCLSWRSKTSSSCRSAFSGHACHRIRVAPKCTWARATSLIYREQTCTEKGDEPTMHMYLAFMPYK